MEMARLQGAAPLLADHSHRVLAAEATAKIKKIKPEHESNRGSVQIILALATELLLSEVIEEKCSDGQESDQCPCLSRR